MSWFTIISIKVFPHCKHYWHPIIVKAIFKINHILVSYINSHVWVWDEPAWAFLVKHYSSIDDTLCRNRCLYQSVQMAVAKNTVWLTAAPAAAPAGQIHWEDFCSHRELSLFLHSQTPSLLAPRLIAPVTTQEQRQASASNFSQLSDLFWRNKSTTHI